MALEKRLQNVPDTPHNREVANHICAGQIALVWPRHGGMLIAADAAANTALPGGRRKLGYPPVFEDFEAGKQSLRRLARLEVAVAVFGHGEPILTGAGAQLRGHFDR